MRDELKDIALSLIDSEDDTYRITTETGIDALCDTVRSIGIVNPPVCIEAHASRYSIVCGFRRIACARHLGWKTVRLRVFAENTTRTECARMAIVDNAMQRPLNLIETSRALHLLSTVLGDSKALAETASVLGLPHHPKMIEKLRDLHRLPKPVRQGIASGLIALPVALELRSMPPAEGVSFAMLFHHLQPSLNKQKEILTWIREIAAREDLSVLDVIQDNRVTAVLNRDDLDRSQKMQQIRNTLRTRRFPNIAQAERMFHTRVKALRLGSGIKLIPPKYFEGSTYALTLTFQNLKDLEARTTALATMIRHPSAKELFS